MAGGSGPDYSQAASGSGPAGSTALGQSQTSKYGVYLGDTPSNYQSMGDFLYGGRGAPQQRYLSKTDANQEYLHFNDAQKAQLKAVEKATGKSASAAWSLVVSGAASYQDQGKMVSAFDLLEILSGAPAGALGGSGGGGGSSGGGGGSGGSFHQSQTSVQLTDAATAHQIADQALTQYLGRAATPEELKNFKTQLNSDERAHPTTTVTDGTASGSSTTSSSTSSGGTSAAQDAIDYAKSRPDYAEYQYATTYGNAFDQALGSPIPGT